MSHSQFHSIEAFILRHAWLSLWDKHMTTGRINQVTTGGRGSTHPTSGSQPLGTLQPGVGCPRLPDRQRSPLQTLPHCTPTAARRQASLRPVLVHAGAVDSSVDWDVGHNGIAWRAKTVQPPLRSQAPQSSTTRLRRVQRPAHPQAAQQAGQCLCRIDKPHTAPQQYAQQNNVFIELTAHSAPSNTVTHNSTDGSLHEHTPHGGQLT